MQTANRIQTVLRLPDSLYQRVKLQALRENRSFNSYVEEKLLQSVELVFPKIPKDFKISDETLALLPKSGKHRSFTQEELDKDPKLAYFVEKYGL